MLWFSISSEDQIQGMATNLKAANTNGTLSGPAGGLNTAATELKSDLSVANAQAFKKANWDSHYGNLVTKDTNANGENLYTGSKDFKTPRKHKFNWIIIPSIVTQWLNFLTYVILLFVYITSLPSMLMGNLVDLIQKLTADNKTDLQLDHSQEQNAGENAKLGKLILMKRWKFWCIIIPSIMTMWSVWSPKTNFVYHGDRNPKNGFGGWKQYASKHVPKESSQECNTDAEANAVVHAWIWHFFDILIPLKIALAIVFIYSLHYKESHSYLLSCFVAQTNEDKATTIDKDKVKIETGTVKDGNCTETAPTTFTTTGGSDAPNILGVCSSTTVATLTTQIESAKLNTTNLTLTLKTQGATITVDGDAEGDSSNGPYTLAGGNLSVSNITLNGDDFPYRLTNIGTLTASLQLSSGTVTIKQDTLITLKLKVANSAQLTVNGANGKTLTGPPFPFSLGAYKVTNNEFLFRYACRCIHILSALHTRYQILKHGEDNPNMFRFGVLPGPFGVDAYGTTRNTSLTFNVTLNNSTTGFQSSGTITITVGAASLKALESPSNVTITLSDGGTIKKYDDPEKPPTPENLKDFKIDETLTKDTKLYILATGTISNPPGLNGSEVTIKATVDVTSSGQPLGDQALTLSPDPDNDPSSEGLGGSITPEGTNNSGPVSISGSSTIKLTGTALESLKSLTENAVTLTGTGGSNFRSSASITVTSTDGNVNFKQLPVSGKLEISKISGSIKKLDEKGKPIELQTTTQLTVGDKLSLDANGEITQPDSARGTNVKLSGTIVVTNKQQQQIGSTLTFSGGPNRTGVGESLSLETNGTIKSDGSKIEIDQNAYSTITAASDTSSSFFTIGASQSSAKLYLHNTTINATGGLKAVATIKATKHGGAEHNGPITSINEGTLRKGAQLQINTQLEAGDILTLSGSANPDVTIEGTIMVTSPGSLGESITLAGLLDGTLTLANGSSNIDVSIGGESLNAKDPKDLAIKGINITCGGLSGTATMEITSDEHDLTTITDPVTINITKLTKDGAKLKTGTGLQSNDTLNLEGTATAGDKSLTLTGKITITNGGNLSSGLRFSGDVTSSGSLTFEDATDGSGVTVTGTLTLSSATLTALQNSNFSLASDNKRALTYKPDLVTKSKISVGTSATGKVKLSGLSLIPVCITNASTGNGFEATANLSLTHTKTSATALKDTGEHNINLTTIATTNLNSAKAEITKGPKDKVASLPAGADILEKETDLVPGDTLTLTITPQGSGTTTTLTGKITVTSPGTLTGPLNLKGGLETSNVSLGGKGTLTSTAGANITNPKYDHMEFHVNHQDTLCCYWGGSHSFGINTTITQASLNLTDLTGSHTLKLQNGDGAVQEVKYTVPEEQKDTINSIKGQASDVKINLKLTLAEVTLTQTSTRSTLKATGTITTTKTVTPTGGQTTLEQNLKKDHDLTFTSNSGLTQTGLPKGTVIIGPRGQHQTLKLTAEPDTDGKPTELTLELKAGTKDILTLSNGSTLNLSGGINGTLTYTDSSGNILIATSINSDTFDQNDFNGTYKIQWLGR
ncbi:uncharacterized protein TA15485 [Theileria annulata]|uniref:Uncharacterized protein n=1 Tax=Theileria annulata TaxID=5874 RepID=Q4UFI7_THEAN|nr:uncharacterized protein TA15485 [Theileria annulata]CAI74129.1 hypothetical protein, conserved [Theileria annulata]|eukprot:XP_951861.1 hypothetical protein, conserved [Theileria annulata]